MKKITPLSMAIFAILFSSQIFAETNIIRMGGASSGESFPNIPARSSGVSTSPSTGTPTETPVETPVVQQGLEQEASPHASTATHIYRLKLGDDVIPVSSCKGYLEAGFGAGVDGVYELTNNGLTFPAYCNQTSFGGGWTAVVAQYQNSTVAWTGGSHLTYDVTLTNNRAWSLSASQLPAHSEVGFSQTSTHGLTVPKYLLTTYSTGEIPKVLVYDNLGTPYHIFRSSTSFYNDHDPEYTIGSASYWNNTLTIDRTGMRGRDWTFAPNFTSVEGRSFAYNGQLLFNSSVAGAFLIWVR